MAVSVLTNVKNDPIAGVFTCTLTAASSEGASGVYCGFIPREISMIQVAGSIGAESRSYYFDGMTAASAVLVAAAGDLTVVSSNGYTLTTGAEGTVTAAATGSPNSSGPGFIVGTGVIANSLGFYLKAVR